MKRRRFLTSLGGVSSLAIANPVQVSNTAIPELTITTDQLPLLPGIWRFTIGKPEKITPQSTRAVDPSLAGIQQLPTLTTCPVEPIGTVNQRGTVVKLPLKADEYVYGLGLQLLSFQQRGLKKMLRVNADPLVDSGDSHAPVPFFVTTSGYGILIDTARNATIYVGNKKKKPKSRPVAIANREGNDGWNALNGPYERLGLGVDSEILIEILRTQGVDVYVFGGPSMLQAVQRYNLFAGGGTLPPRWGLGFWYRVQSDFSQDEVLKMADYFRQSKIPCDVLGLEPHWHSHSYSCSYVWGHRFPTPAKLLTDLKVRHFRLNLWEHAFVHPKAPFYEDMLPHSGDYEVWDGLVPDFLTPKGRQIYADYHKKAHVDLGVSGYKADECDNSDFTGNWSFPELSQFPSGADGEQMHNLFGLRYQDTIMSIFREKKERTYNLVRSSGALASPYPFVLYSDLYNHRQFIHGIAQSSFSGLLWTPEVRHAESNEDLIRRLQSVIFSPLAMINAWYLKNAPWKQIDRKANNDDRFADNWEALEAQCRTIIEWRMKLIPHLHAAFVRYQRLGIPPFRALILDYPNDPAVRTISNQFMVGETMLVAPVVAGEKSRKVYLPEGDWYDLWSQKKYAGKQAYTLEVPLEEIPVFIKSDTILPLAKPTLHTDDPESWKLTAMVFGDHAQPAVLYEDDNSWAPALTEIKLEWESQTKKGTLTRSGKAGSQPYTVIDWNVIA